MRRLRNRAGLSLVEVTIMLLVLMLLAGVLAPSIMDFVRDAQWVKVKEDCEAIGDFRRAHDARRPAVLQARRHRRLHGGQPRRPPLERRDHGRRHQPDLVRLHELHPRRRQRHRPAELGHEHHRPGRQHGTAPGAERPSRAVPRAQRAVPADGSGGPAAGHRLARRVPVGADRPRSLGRRLHGELGVPLDGHRRRLAEAEGQNGTSWNRDVFCLSGGPNRQYETYFGGCLGTVQFGTCREGDDFTFVIQGGTR